MGKFQIIVNLTQILIKKRKQRWLLILNLKGLTIYRQIMRYSQSTYSHSLYRIRSVGKSKGDWILFAPGECNLCVCFERALALIYITKCISTGISFLILFSNMFDES